MKRSVRLFVVLKRVDKNVSGWVGPFWECGSRCGFKRCIFMDTAYKKIIT